MIIKVNIIKKQNVEQFANPLTILFKKIFKKIANVIVDGFKVFFKAILKIVKFVLRNIVKLFNKLFKNFTLIINKIGVIVSLAVTIMICGILYNMMKLE